ncbi:hypothetical protein [Sphingobium sp. YR768]|uniref:hypothetical protein n=1 Tax=Sphingobium sp. YR768 TaxID=1884365 RepID=UPI0008ABA47F|nr:hypothetical protein [Sphingobium sp. YR768]SES09025.1 hypothetical protein SAMN05518866_13766 [Sphingobium sp. YR768]
MTELPTMRAAFRTTISGGGKYEMVFRFPSMDAMHIADEEWHTFRASQEVEPAAPVKRDLTSGEDQEAARELVRWWDTGVLLGPVLKRQAEEMLRSGKADADGYVRQAEQALIDRIVRQFVAQASYPTGAGERKA